LRRQPFKRPSRSVVPRLRLRTLLPEGVEQHLGRSTRSRRIGNRRDERPRSIGGRCEVGYIPPGLSRRPSRLETIVSTRRCGGPFHALP
jgi:hypothetical protein